jgi:hypothetical protein
MLLCWRQTRDCVAVRSKNYGLKRSILSVVVWLCAAILQKPTLALDTLSWTMMPRKPCCNWLSRACSLGSQKPEHFLLPKHLSRIKYGPDAGKRGYDRTQHQNCWRKALASLTEKANLKGLRFHDLRHTFITHMIERGAPVALIQSLVGHLNARMVRHYTHITTGAARNAVALLDGEPILEQTAFNRAVQLELQLR